MKNKTPDPRLRNKMNFIKHERYQSVEKEKDLEKILLTGGVSPRDATKQMLILCNVMRKKNFNVSTLIAGANQERS